MQRLPQRNTFTGGCGLMRTLIIFFLMCGVCFGQISVVEKPVIDTDKILTSVEQGQVKEYLSGKIFKDLTPVKNDYINNDNRGTVKFNPKKSVNILGREVFDSSNYSNHRVIIPNNTIIKEVNFSQNKPHTTAIIGKNLHFIGCNLGNVEIDPTWTFEHCLCIHSKDEIENVDGKSFKIHYVEKDDKWMEVDREEIITE